MRLGLLGARADRGGLASQTREFHRHLSPDRTLVVDLGAARGPVDLSWYPDATVVRGGEVPADVLDCFLDGLDVLWCAETPYRADAFGRARQAGVRTVCHANPELWKGSRPDLVLAPTSWRLDLLPDPVVLPFPVARDRFPFRRRTQARTFVHAAAPAMADRNGTDLVLAALRHVRVPVRMVVLGRPGKLPSRVGRVAVEQGPETADYWRWWPDDGDVLLLPRRYAGQSLPMNEALSLGMPVVSLDVAPQNEWLPAEALVPVTRRSPRRMAGGVVQVADADPKALARVMDRLASDPAMVARCSDEADRYAESIAWETLLPRFQALLAGENVERGLTKSLR